MPAKMLIPYTHVTFNRPHQWQWKDTGYQNRLLVKRSIGTMKKVTRYKGIHFNPAMIDNFTSVFSCTTVSRVSDEMMVLSSICLRSAPIIVVLGWPLAVYLVFVLLLWFQRLNPLLCLMCFNVLYHKWGRELYADLAHICNSELHEK